VRIVIILKWLLYILIFLLIAIYILMNFIISFSAPDEKTIAKYAEAGVPLTIKTGSVDGRTYQFLETVLEPTDTTPVILFVHGAPGAAGMFDRFLMDVDLLEKGILVSIDRLGYGHSGLGDSETSFAKQADQLHDLISQYPNRKIIAVGHSFGGPIITQLAIDYPNNVDGLVLLAPALDPELEKYQGLAKTAKWKLTRWYFPELVRVSADEKLTHVAELKQMESKIEQIKIPVLHIHGDKDSVVPYGNLAFSEKHFREEILQTETFTGSDHFLVEGKDYPQTKEALLEFIMELGF